MIPYKDRYLTVSGNDWHHEHMTATASESMLVQLRKGVLEYCVLASLVREPSYGLKLSSDLVRFPTLFASEGSLYPLLARLRKQGWVETNWRESTSGPPRRYYNVTPAGHEALASFLGAWGPFTDEASRVLKGER